MSDPVAGLLAIAFIVELFKKRPLLLLDIFCEPTTKTSCDPLIIILLPKISVCDVDPSALPSVTLFPCKKERRET